MILSIILAHTLTNSEPRRVPALGVERPELLSSLCGRVLVQDDRRTKPSNALFLDSSGKVVERIKLSRPAIGLDAEGRPILEEAGFATPGTEDYVATEGPFRIESKSGKVRVLRGATLLREWSSDLYRRTLAVNPKGTLAAAVENPYLPALSVWRLDSSGAPTVVTPTLRGRRLGLAFWSASITFVGESKIALLTELPSALAAERVPSLVEPKPHLFNGVWVMDRRLLVLVDIRTGEAQPLLKTEEWFDNQGFQGVDRGRLATLSSTNLAFAWRGKVYLVDIPSTGQRRWTGAGRGAQPGVGTKHAEEYVRAAWVHRTKSFLAPEVLALIATSLPERYCAQSSVWLCTMRHVSP